MTTFLAYLALALLGLLSLAAGIFVGASILLATSAVENILATFILLFSLAFIAALAFLE